MMLKLLKNFQKNCSPDDEVSPEYLVKLGHFIARFKFWNPECYAFIEGGVMQGASANCSLVLTLFDVENEKADIDNPIPFQERLDEWNYMISSSHDNGSLKPIL